MDLIFHSVPSFSSLLLCNEGVDLASLIPCCNIERMVGEKEDKLSWPSSSFDCYPPGESNFPLLDKSTEVNVKISNPELEETFNLIDDPSSCLSPFFSSFEVASTFSDLPIFFFSLFERKKYSSRALSYSQFR